MILARAIAAFEILLSGALGLYLLVGLGTSPKSVEWWAVVIIAGIYWWATIELWRHGRELVRRQKEIEEEG